MVDDFYWRAFWDLSTTRQHGMGIGGIPWDKMVRYAEIHEVYEENIPAFLEVMTAMDRAYLEWHVEEAEAKRKPAAERGGKRL